MSLPVVRGPYEKALPSRSTRVIKEHHGRLVLPAPAVGAPRRLAVRANANHDWTAVAQSLLMAAVGTEHVVSFFVMDRHRVVRSIGLPGLAELTGPIFVTRGMLRSVDLDAVVLHQFADVVKWHGQELSSTKAATAISQYAEKFKKWYLPAGQPFVKKAMPVWLKPDIGSTLQDVLSALTAFQRAGLIATRVELR